MKKIYILVILVTLTGLLFTSAVSAQTNTWDGSSNNNWNTAANWSLNAVPTAAHDVVININAAISVDVSVTINSLTVNGSATVSFTSSGGGRTITIDNNGSSIGSGSTLTLQGSTGSGTRSMNLAFAGGGTRTMSIAGTLVLTNVGDGTSYSATNSSTTVTGTLKNDGTSGGTAATITSTAANLAFSSGGTYEHALNGGTIPTATWNAASTCNITGITNTDPSGDGQAFGNLIYNCSGMSGNRAMAGSGLSVAGNFQVLNTGSGELQMSQTSVNVTGNCTISDNFRIGSNTARTLNVSGNVIVNGGTLDMSDGTAVGTMNVSGDFSVSAGTITESGSGSGAIVFNKSGTQTYASGGTVSNTINFSVNSGSTLQMAVAGTTVNGGGTFTLSSGAALGVTSPAGITSTGATGNIQVTGTRTFNSGASYIYNGSAAQVTGNGLPATISGFTINNASGVTLSQSVSVSGVSTFTNGILTSTSANLLTISAAGSVSGASNTSFVDGPVAKTGNTAFTFPVGKTGTGYQPIGIAAISASTTFTAEYFRSSASAKGAANAPLQVVSKCEHWGLFASSAVGVDVTLYWNANSGCSSAGYINNLAVLRIARYNGASGSTWSNASNFNSQGPGSNGTSGNMTATLASGAFTNPTFFTFGSTDAGQSPLPVMYANVKAYTKTGGVQIEWSNLTERDMVGYDVQRSADGVSFTNINHYAPKNNLNDKADYADFDAAPLSGTNYYRIKAIEISGKIIYSKILRVETGNTVKQQISMYPNPVTGNQVTVGLNNVKAGLYTLRIVNTAGQDVLTQTITNQGTSTSETIQLPSSIKPGVYTMLISGSDFRENKMFIVQ